MKKILYTMILMLSLQATVFGQCQAYFTTSFISSTDSLYVNNQSYNTDSSQIVITNCTITAQYGGASYTVSGNTGQFACTNYSGLVYICMTISTSTGCTSTYCDSVYVNGGNNNCVANFSYTTDSMHAVYFIDQSIPEYPSGTFTYSWTFTGGTPATSNLANPVVTFPGNGTWHVCLTVSSDSGCTATYCEDIYLMDSTQTNCTLSVASIITQVSTIGGADGSIDLTVSGGTPPYQYYWNTGAITEDLYGLTSGTYMVNILQLDSLCPATSATFQIIEPYDSIPLDTLIAPPVDTCLNFVPDSFYVVIVNVDSMNATITWIFTGQGMSVTFTVPYQFTNYGPYAIAFSMNCDSAKGLTTYMTYVNFTEYLGLTENETLDFRAYPNPFTEHLDLEMPAGAQNVTIYNGMGQQVWTAPAIHAEKLSIDASAWPAGFYLIRIQGKESETSRMMIRQ